MKITEAEIPGVLLIEPKVFPDPRGHFLELYQGQRYPLPPLVQDNISVSTKGVLRGLHLQNPHSQGKLVTVLQGEVFDVAVEVRRGSPHFGRWVGYHLDGKSYRQLYIPAGMAHGFYVLSESATFLYKCTDYYSKASELTIRWDDPQIGITWPGGEKFLSEKDEQGIRLADIDPARLPAF